MGIGISNRASAVVSTLVFALCASAPSYAVQKQYLSKTEHVSGEILVRVKEQGTRAESTIYSALLQSLGSDSVLNVRSLQTDKQVKVVKLAKDSDLQTAIEKLKAESAIEFAEPNYRVHAFDNGIPNDPDFAKTWGIKNTGQTDSNGQVGTAGSDINVVPLWQKGFTGSKNVLVAVIDTGIDWTHPDLAANLYTNPGEDGKDSTKDNDGNGFVYDIHGWNFAAHTNQSQDDHGHGSHCSGTIGGVGNNGVGVAGINWQVSLMPVKFLDAQGGGSLEGAVESINYARMMKVNVMSNSWGGGGYSDVLKKAIDDTKAAGIIFVAAAGNDGSSNDSSPTYPASYDSENIIAVAATDNKDGIANFSNYGSKSVHVAAPGVNVYSTVKGGGYQTMSGTSMATPHISGIAALLLSANPTWTYSDVKTRLIATSDPVPGLKRKVMAKGRVNAYNAMYNIVPPSTDPAEGEWKTLPQVIESAHPYPNGVNLTYPVHVDGAKMIRVHFEKVDTEARYDHVYVEGKNAVIEDLSGAAADYTTDYVTGDSLVIRLTSDSSVNGYGFKIDKVQYIPK